MKTASFRPTSPSTCQTGSAADVIFGEAGNDGLAGGLGADAISGGAGKDILVDGSIAGKNGRTLRRSLDAYVALPPNPTTAQYNALASYISFTKDTASRDTLNGDADNDRPPLRRAGSRHRQTRRQRNLPQRLSATASFTSGLSCSAGSAAFFEGESHIFRGTPNSQVR